MLVVDDSILHRELIKNIVNETGIAKVEYTASNGITALERIKYSKFDVILLDTIMPELDGLETLKIIRKKYPQIKVIMISEKSSEDTKLTIEALNNGAVDFIKRPTTTIRGDNVNTVINNLKMLLNEIFIEKNTISELDKKDKYKNISLQQEVKYEPKKFNNPDVILIAASTGGPIALEEVLKKLNSNINKPILIVQHMPSNFTKSLAKALDKVCSLVVSEARSGEIIKRGTVLIAEGGLHMVVKDRDGQKIIKTEESPYVKGVRPSADVLFKSIAREYIGKKVLVIILTGMGSDGTEGVEVLKEYCECYCITQSEDSCVVYGMPRCVDEKGLSDESLNIIHIGNRINKLMQV